ncbi:hypothetical protein CVT26_003300 [Gymnopilus dilepis]|uniref:Uncharacterized protein n=1 Tax=Gymnopilus dilepis TaxID=231916 RepID=A0A409Y4V7_9AGAR|nr:hypothetical protein CVT26_003300 [Gymnopilus dilepis]
MFPKLAPPSAPWNSRSRWLGVGPRRRWHSPAHPAALPAADDHLRYRSDNRTWFLQMPCGGIRGLNAPTKGRNSKHLFVSFIPLAATFFATTVFAFPVNGYQAGDLAFVAGHKEYKAIGKEHAKAAKEELHAAGESYNVKTQFHGAHYAEHGEKAMSKARKEWHNNKNLQQFRHADRECPAWWSQARHCEISQRRLPQRHHPDDVRLKNSVKYCKIIYMTAFHMPCHELLSPRNVAVGEFVILDASHR